MAFFTIIPYDIRLIIYTFIPLPPLSYANTGLMLTCRLAYQELCDAAMAQTTPMLRDVVKDYEEEVGHKIQMPKAIHGATDYLGLRDITINMPHSAIDEWSIPDLRGKTPKLLACMYPIFTGCFDRLKIFVHWDQERGEPSKARRHERSGVFPIDIEGLIKEAIEYVASTPDHRSYDVKRGELRLRQFDIAWDFRKEGSGFGEECLLRGIMRDEFFPARHMYRFEVFIELENEDGGVGEWQSLCADLRPLKMGDDESVDCWSRGIGREIFFGEAP